MNQSQTEVRGSATFRPPRPTTPAQTPVPHLVWANRFGHLCMMGGFLFAASFLGLNQLLSNSAKCTLWCITSLCLLGAPLGLLSLHSSMKRLNRTAMITGVLLSLAGLSLYMVGSLFIFQNPDRALKQYFTPAGSALLMLGTLIIGCAVVRAGRMKGWRAVMPILTALYFPLQFPLQAFFFLSKGSGPNPILLGMWGLFWILLGYAIESTARRLPHER